MSCRADSGPTQSNIFAVPEHALANPGYTPCYLIYLFKATIVACPLMQTGLACDAS